MTTLDKQQRIDQALAWHREQLLDLSSRNTLLHFPTREKSGKLKAKRLELMNGEPDELYRSLVINGHSVVFEGLDEAPAMSAADEDDLDFFSVQVPTLHARKNELVVQVPVKQDELQKRLLQLNRNNREFLEEQGVHGLYLALGQLKWYERDSSHKYEPRLAPLLLIPVNLHRRNSSEAFRLSYSGEELQSNFTLNLKLREYGKGIPELAEADELTPSSYFEQVRGAVKAVRPSTAESDDWFETPVPSSTDGLQWQVDPTFAALGFFSFSKILMYRDLQPDSWPQGVSAYDHPVVASLLAGHDSEQSLPDDLSADDAIHSQTTLHVLDADSSQALAVEYVLRGHDLVLQGPPGTGKSQTITNMIAGLVAQGKKVLFVAEKQAALSVVETRLQKIGLGHALLALHSKTASKTVLRDSLQTALYQERDAALPPGDETRLDELVTQLRDFPEALNTQLGELPLTPYDVIGKLLALQQQNIPATTGLVPVPAGLMQWNTQDWKRANELLEELALWVTEHGAPQSLPLWGSSKTGLLPQDQVNLRSSTQALHQAIRQAQVAAQEVNPLLEAAPATINDLQVAAGLIEQVSQWPDLSGLDLNADWASLETTYQAHAEVQKSHRVALERTLAAIPSAEGAWREAHAVVQNRDALREWLDLSDDQQQRHAALQGLIHEAALTAEVGDVRATLSQNRGLLSGLRSDVRQAKQKVQGWLKQPGKLEEQLGLLAQIEEYQALGRRLSTVRQTLSAWPITEQTIDVAKGRELLDWLDKRSHHPLNADDTPVHQAARQALAALMQGRTLDISVLDTLQEQESQLQQAAQRERPVLGAQSQGLTTDWANLVRTAAWVKQTVRDRPHWQGTLVEIARTPSSKDQWMQKLTTLRQKTEELDQALEAFRKAASFEQLPTDELAALAEITEQSAQDASALTHIISWNQLAERLQNAGLQDLTPFLPSFPPAEEWSTLVALVRQAWLAAIAQHAFSDRPPLARFESGGYQRGRQQYSTLDRKSLELNRQRIRHTYLQRVPKPSSVGQLGVLQKEFAKKKRLLPVRDVLRHAGQAVQAIKPVFMMSPLSLANFIPLGTLTFDVVIFDEASQVRPSDALGALLRAKQFVVVGDLKQLGPSNFFSKTAEDSEEDDGGEAGLESLLAMFEARYVGQRHSLTWHYRSQHEELIRTSNECFYDNQLVTFPHADPLRHDLGLRYHHLDPRQAPFGRGGSTTNPGEAQAVVEAVIRHARHSPQESLAVVTFSAKQQALIEGLLDQALAKLDPKTQAFFSENVPDPFVVKNLENVQGDERDVIMISVGYGYALKDGELKFYRNFGPLGSVDGWRRLNVLITRARKRLEVFANFQPHDITGLDETSELHRGMRAFKIFLERCAQDTLRRTSDLPLGGSENRDAQVPDRQKLSALVSTVLTDAGYQVAQNIGSSSSRIDLAVRFPDDAKRFALGIELDGPGYYKVGSVRERDRLREEVLEVFGWRIYRVWSIDWFRDAASAQKQLLDAVREAVNVTTLGSTGQTNIQDQTAEAFWTNLEESSADPSLPQLSAAELWHEADGTQEFGLSEESSFRTSRRSATRSSTSFKTIGAAVSATPYTEAQISVDSSGLDFHLIPLNRLVNAIEGIVRQEGPILQELVLRRLLAALEIARAGGRIKETFGQAVAEAARQNLIVLDGDFMALNDEQWWTARNREGRPAGELKIDLIANQELLFAALEVVDQGMGVVSSELPNATLRYLGFRKFNQAAQDRVKGLIEWATGEGLLIQNGELLTRVQVNG